MQPKASAEEWQKRVERWRESGLTAEQFASELGINAGTLKFWQYKLNKAKSGGAVTRRTRKAATLTEPAFVEVRGTATEARFDIELRYGRRLRVPMAFDPSVLEKLVTVLERA